MKRIITLILALILCACSMLTLSSCSSSDEDWGASVDWGKGNYWDSNTHSVKRNVWYDFFHS